MEDRELVGLVALITGASRGIGKATALRLAEAGADLVLVARSYDPLADVAESARQKGVKVQVVAGDVAEPATAERAVELAIQEFERLDILVNNAGTNVPARMLDEVTVKDWQRVIDVNLNAAFYFVRATLPALRMRGGSIVNVVSWAATAQAYWAGAAYTASKAGLLAMTTIVNAEERGNRIRACAILPGEVDAGLIGAQPEDVAAGIRAEMLSPSDIATAVLYVVSSPPHVNVEEIIVRPLRLRNRAAGFQRVINDKARKGSVLS